MEPGQSGQITELLVKWRDGDERALEALTPLVYEALRQVARRRLSRERPGHTLNSTALVHEVYLKLVDQRSGRWENRSQFFAIAARLMRRILVDHARRRHAGKRGATSIRLSFDEAIGTAASQGIDLIALDDALLDLERNDPQQNRIVELRFFGGLTIAETASVMRISPATVKRDWAMAKAWLYGELSR